MVSINPIITFCIGFFGMMIIDIIRHALKRDGTLKIDHSNPKKDVYRLELDCEVEDLPKKKYVVLKVVNGADLSLK